MSRYENIVHTLETDVANLSITLQARTPVQARSNTKQMNDISSMLRYVTLNKVTHL